MRIISIILMSLIILTWQFKDKLNKNIPYIVTGALCCLIYELGSESVYNKLRKSYKLYQQEISKINRN